MSGGKRSLQILDHVETPLGVLSLRRRELLSRPGTVVTEVTLDGEFLMSSLYTESEVALATRALAWHGGGGLSVLVGGLGLGYTAQAALDHAGVARVEVHELLPEVISWLERDLVPLAGSLRGDPRLLVVQANVFERLAPPSPASLPPSPPPPPRPRSAGSPDGHDIIIIDVDHSPDELLEGETRPFYTAPGLRSVRGHLADGGVLGVWSSAESPAFVEALGEVFAEVRVETIDWRNELIDRDQTDTLFFARR